METNLVFNLHPFSTEKTRITRMVAGSDGKTRWAYSKKVHKLEVLLTQRFSMIKKPRTMEAIRNQPHQEKQTPTNP